MPGAFLLCRPLDGDVPFSVLKAALILYRQLIAVHLADHCFGVRAFEIPKNESEGMIVDPLVGAGRWKGGKSDVMVLGSVKEIRTGPGRNAGCPAAIPER